LKTIILSVLIITTGCFNLLLGQLLPEEKKLLRTANEYFHNKEFEKALPLYHKLDSVTEDIDIIYKIGVCYLNSDYQKIKALPYLEYSVINNIQHVPITLHKDLGTMYHYMYRFEDAIKEFKTYLKKAESDELAKAEDIAYSKRMLEICNNAIELTSQLSDAEVEILEFIINTRESEYCPIVTADEQRLFYMHSEGYGKEKEKNAKILLSKKSENGRWGKAVELIIEDKKLAEYPITLAGVSPDGKNIFLNIGRNLSGDIYEGYVINDSVIVNITKLNENINTSFYEGRASISSDGTELFFVSDRPGGYGKKDIYKSERVMDFDWSKPVNLGSQINTIYNEDSPFMHPDGKTLLFSSEGHKTMGGSDIFKSVIKNNQWSEPENLKFPNSTKDDLYFSLDASGQIGYFSSSKSNFYDKHNIYKANLKEPIPLTLLKGTITMGYPPKPVPAKIKVFDKETGKQIKYIYNPDPETGKYLMIFPPSKNYDIIIDAEGFMPQVINVHIPHQTYFYELYQEINLTPVMVDNVQIGEEVTVNNMFYNMYKTDEADSLFSDKLPKAPEYYDHLLELVENIIQTTDTIRFAYSDKHDENNNTESTDRLLDLIENAIETTDSVTLSIIDANSKQKEKVKNTLFYSDNDTKEPKHIEIYGNDTVYSAPPISTISSRPKYITNDIRKNKPAPAINTNFKNYDEHNRKYIYKTTLYYDTNVDQLNNESHKSIEQIIILLMNNPSLGAEIYGYADASGSEAHNMILSKNRAKNVMLYISYKNIDPRRLIAKGYGEIESGNYNSEENENHRKVEINVFEIIE